MMEITYENYGREFSNKNFVLHQARVEEKLRGRVRGRVRGRWRGRGRGRGEGNEKGKKPEGRTEQKDLLRVPLVVTLMSTVTAVGHEDSWRR